MKKSRLILLFVFSMLVNISIGQSNVYVQGASGLSVGDFTINASSREASTFTKGSPYYNKDFMFGELKLQDGNNLKGLFRYNIYGQELELIVEKDTLFINDPTKIKTLNFGGKSFIYSLILDEKKNKDFISGAYFETLNQGECKVLIKREIDLRENKYTAYYGGGGGDGSKRYIPEETYYIKVSDDKPALKIKNSSSIFKILNNHKAEIEKYISDNKLKANKNQDLIKIVEYYNTLL